MNNATLETEAVTNLLEDANGRPHQYLIPSYQRGYRWTHDQINQLLDDLLEFIQDEEQPFYCLQPIVFRPLADGRFEVVDGQQRLTTIHIILTTLAPQLKALEKTCFQITYATRIQDSVNFLAEIDDSYRDQNIDYYHICEGKKAVEKWFRGENKKWKMKLLTHLLNEDEVGRNVRIIRFELPPDQNAIDAFTRLNVGKIPLTNDELIRALFLQKAKESDGNIDPSNTQLRIAYEWDLMEKTLQQDEFWYFLQNDRGGQGANRISLVFETLVKGWEDSSTLPDNRYQTFYAFGARLSALDGDIRKLWEEIKQQFMTLEEWYSDRTLFHLVGFLVECGTSIHELRKLSHNEAKSEFQSKLKNLAYRKLFPEPKEGEERSGQIEGALSELRYKGRHLREVLLLFNLATLLEDERSNIRFQFSSYKSQNWDIEHVRAQTNIDLARHTDRQKFFKGVKPVLELETNDEAKALHRRVRDFIEATENEARDEFEPLYDDVLAHFHESIDDESGGEDIDRLGNLTLLDQGTNRSFKNAPFAAKRQYLLGLDRSGIFVPLCTRNIFLKAYTEQVKSPLFWDEDDRDAYENQISRVLISFFKNLHPVLS